jgi:primosomal protein N' (replication factor Y)
MIRHFLEVSFPFGLPKETLTYHLDLHPDEPVPTPGCRVEAPIQNRRHIGYLIDIHTRAPEFRTLAVSGLLDHWPLLSPELVRLGCWIADRYVCSAGEAFHAMLPAGIKQRLIRFIEATASSRQKTEAGEVLPNALSWLVHSGRTALAEFVKTFPATHRKIPEWLAAGAIEIHHQRTAAAGPKIRRVLVLKPDGQIALDGLTPKEKTALEFMLHRNQPVTAAEVQRGAAVSAAPINQLLQKGIILSVQERVMREVGTEAYYSQPPEPLPVLTASQDNALREIRAAWAGHRRPLLIWGVTCSGKTEIYLRWVAEMLKTDRSVIVLVPEISLTPQMTKRFRDRFGEAVAILHSRLSDGERFDQWEQIRRGHCRVIVGARSAVFAPVQNLGAIIIDEEGEPSFKQNDVPRYHARDVAEQRCIVENALLIMGSATPTMDSFQRAQEGRYQLIRLPERVSERFPPKATVVDMREELVARKNRTMFSAALRSGIEQALKEKHQIILYLNRRGYSSFVLCRMCGKAVECSRCQVSLVYHSGSQILRCHYCGEARPIPTICPSCQGTAIKFFGAGTQRIEAEARRYFPQARIQRMDSDTTSASGSLEDILDRLGRGEIDILIGTQMVAKGLDFPNVTLVGIMAADNLLRLPDFRASERNFSLLAQVSGRAGRGRDAGSVVLQTYNPEHHSIRHALTEDYAAFFAEESGLRKKAGFPPFLHVALIGLAGENLDKVREVSREIRSRLDSAPNALWIEIMGPAPAPIEKLQNRFRYQILVKFSNLTEALVFLKQHLFPFHPSGVRIALDIDPYYTL